MRYTAVKKVEDPNSCDVAAAAGCFESLFGLFCNGCPGRCNCGCSSNSISRCSSSCFRGTSSRRNSFFNTCTIMAISVLALWVSSFQVATLISSSYLPTPTFNSVKQVSFTF